MTLRSSPLHLIFFLCFSSVYSQSDSLSQSEEYYNLGMEVFNYQHRKQATELFTLATQWNPKSAKAQLMCGKSIMLTIDKQNSLPYFKKAWALDNRVDEDIIYLIGRAHHYSEHYDSAILYYEQYNKILARSLRLEKSNKIKEVNRKIFECRNALFYMQKPVDVTITHLPGKVNSEYPDYAPAINADESILYFTSRRPDQNMNAKMAEDLEYFEEILYSVNMNGEWQEAKAMPPPINTEYHNSCIAISPDGREMILYTDANGGDLLIAYRDNSGVWSSPKPMVGINTDHIENSATFSSDNKYLFFTSNRPGGYGGTDIYKAELAQSGNWGKVQNLGPIINTDMDEEAPFISTSGKHLYFSSNGHAGMGDLDLYKSELDPVTGLWGQPVNLGYPINSPENDIYFVLNSDESVAYFSSVRKEGIGEQDIYRIDMKKWKGPEDAASATSELFKFKPLPIPQSEKTTPATLSNVVHLNITLIDVTSKQKLDGQVLLSANNASTVFTRRELGNYISSVKTSPTETTKGRISVSCSGYQPEKLTLYLGGFSTAEVTLNDTLYLHKIKEEAPPTYTQETLAATNVNVPLKLDVYFALDSDQPLSFDGVKEFITLMKNSPTMKVELAGHTDNVGDEIYNQKLSERRANSVKQYMVTQGINESRIKAIGYGASKPVDTSNTVAGNRRNRRTEFIILEK